MLENNLNISGKSLIIIQIIILYRNSMDSKVPLVLKSPLDTEREVTCMK